MISDVQKIDQLNSLLLVGIGATTKYHLDIVKPESKSDMAEAFGDCELTKAYNLLSDMNCENIYAVNLENKHDLLNFSLIAKEHNFSYIILIDIYATDVFYDPMRNGRKTFYVQYLVQKLSKTNSISTVLTTDAKASLYEDIDDYLNDMNNKIIAIRNQRTSDENFENLMFVANNLTFTNYANVYLAGMILSAEINEYPNYPAKNEYGVVFSIDDSDLKNEMVYFKKHSDGSITVENLLNMYPGKSPIKIFTIYRIMKYIGSELDFSEYIGKLYTVYQEKQIELKTDRVLGSLLGFVILDYKIMEIYSETDTAHPGTSIIHIKLEILPVNCTERYILDKRIGI